jgi:ParB/RepB/Spo0J family partition protein
MEQGVNIMSKFFGTTKEIPIDSIVTESRGREDYGDMLRMKESVARHGLINPITVYSPSGNPPYKLVAGERRLMACRELHLKIISARIYDHELTQFELKSIELFENLDRKDMTEIEKAKMTKELHELLVSINGPKIARVANAPGHSMKDTAEMLGRTPASITQDIKLAEAIEQFPELQLDQAPNKLTAMRMLNRMSAAIANRVVAESMEAETDKNANPLLNCYRIQDFRTIELPPNSFGFLEVDPPYAIDLHTIRQAAEKGALTADYNEIPANEYGTFLMATAQKCYELASDSAWVIFWHAPSWQRDVISCLQAAGFQTNPVPGIWTKGNSPGQSLSPDSALGNSYESFIYARKGRPKLRQMGRSNVFNFPPPHPLHRIHPTERPKELLREIFNTFVWPRTPVLVPFAGSGNTLSVALEYGHPCVGFDLSEIYRNAFLHRQKQLEG